MPATTKPKLISTRPRPEAMRDSIVEHWSVILDQETPGWLDGHQTAHALLANDPQAAIRHAYSYEDWSRSSESIGVDLCPQWEQWTDQLPAQLRVMEANEESIRDASLLAKVVQTRSALPTAIAAFRKWTTVTMKRYCWERINTQLLESGKNKIVLFGAGRHTRWLLNATVLDPSIEVAMVLDDNPAEDLIRGIPVRPSDTINDIDASVLRGAVMLPSSDAYEEALLERARVIADPLGIEVFPVYTDPGVAGLSHDQAAKYSAETEPPAKIPPVILLRDPKPIAQEGKHRTALGLDAHRDWTEPFAARYARPSWTQGHINNPDAAFLWDCIESARPERIIEIGTASGMSTLAFALGVDHFGPTTASPVVHSFDLTGRCYFDPRYAVGDAMRQAAPDLVDSVVFHSAMTARDAALHFERRSVGLALIDADHRHPGATLDLLALLPVLKDGALVVLHDIDLDAIRAKAGSDAVIEDGPKQLYDAWCFEKTRDSAGEESNIGVLRVPSDRGAVLRLLCGLCQ